MTSKFITQTKINGSCKHPDLWPDINVDAGSFILDVGTINGNIIQVGVKYEANYITPTETLYSIPGTYTFTVPEGVTNLHYGVTTETGGARVDSFKLGIKSIKFSETYYTADYDQTNLVDPKIIVSDDGETIILKYSSFNSTNQFFKVSYDHGISWTTHEISTTFNNNLNFGGKLSVGGFNNEIYITTASSSGQYIYSTDNGLNWTHGILATSLSSEYLSYNGKYFIYHNNAWYIMSQSSKEVMKSTNLVDWEVIQVNIESVSIPFENITSFEIFNRLTFTDNNRIYIASRVNIASTTHNGIIPIMYYTEDDFATIHYILHSDYKTYGLTEYRHVWPDSITGDFYFIDATGRKVYRTKDFVTSKLLASNVTAGLSLDRTGLSKDYFYLITQNSFVSARILQINRYDDSYEVSDFSTMYDITVNSSYGLHAVPYNSTSHLIYWNNSTMHYSILKPAPDSTDYTGTYTNDNNSHSTDTWISDTPIGQKMIWKNNQTVTPGQTFTVSLTGAESNAIFRWGTGNSIIV